METEETLSKTAQKVAEALLTAELSVDDLCVRLERGWRTVYRAIQEINKQTQQPDSKYELIRKGEKGAYVWSIQEKTS